MGAIFFDLSPLNVGGFFNETCPRSLVTYLRGFPVKPFHYS